MEGVINPGAERAARIRGAVTRHLSNATASWQGGQAFGVIFNRAQVEGFLGDAITAERQTVAMCIANAPGIAEGSTALVLAGQPCEVTGPVVADASGWATFPIVFLN